MRIFNHRGQERGPQNISQELDLRINSGKIMLLAHDAAGQGYSEGLCGYLLDRKEDNLDDGSQMYALNIKEDGLAPYIKEELRGFIPLDRIFCFDMSQAEIQHYLRLEIPIATRASSYGIERPFGDYVWFDWYYYEEEYPHLMMDDWKRYAEYIGYEQSEFKFIAVSPELHGATDKKIIERLWQFCKDQGFWGLCTDLTEEAGVFFNGDQGGTIRS